MAFRSFARTRLTASAALALMLLMVLTLNPRATFAQVQLPSHQTAGGDPAESVRAAQEAANSDPGNVAARIALARSLLSANDLGRAGRELVALQKEHPNVAEVHNLLGMLALIRNNIAPARAAFDRALAIEPASLDALSGHIALDFKENNPPAGRARIENRLKEGPVTSGLLLLAARTYLIARDQPAAETVLRQAIEADPSQLASYALLGQLYMSQKKLDQAIAELEALAVRQSKPVAALTMSAMVMETQGKTDLATKRYQEVLALDSSAVIASNNLAWIYAESGTNLDAALGLAQTAVTKAPDTPELMDTLGWVYYKKNLPQLAIPLFLRCVEKAPRDASYHYHLGLAYLQSGDQTRGRVALQRALEAKPDARIAEEIRGALGTIPPAAP